MHQHVVTPIAHRAAEHDKRASVAGHAFLFERARRLGFSLKEVAELLTLWRDRHRASADVRHLAEAQIRRVDARLSELQDMRRSLQHLMERCHGDDRPDCPILEELAGQG